MSVRSMMPVGAPADGLSLPGGLTVEERARPALVMDDQTVSFGELAEAAAGLAARLARRGLRAGDRAAFVAAPSMEVVLAIAALAAMGVTLVPIHPRLSAAEARVVIDVARADHVLDPGELARAAFAGDRAPSPSRPPAGSSPPPFAIVSTSGTTGRPKGAVLSRRAFLASAEASAKNLGWREEDRWLVCLPLAHVGGLSIVTRCLAARRAMVLLPRFDPSLVLDAIRRRGVTLLSVVPTMLHALLEADTEGVLRSPRALLLGGAAAPPALLDACAERRVLALTTYGLTEACSQVTTQPPRDPSVRLAGSGAPLDGVEVHIVDDGGAPLPPGVAGRILIGGPVLFDGYLAADGHTLHPARVPPPRAEPPSAAHTLASPDLFDTGDIGELDEIGHLHVHVRRTDLIVTGGENVYPVEIEQALERVAGVRRALVFGIPDDRWGQLVGAVLQTDPARLAEPAALTELSRILSEFCTTHLAPHKRPRRVGFVADLPLTPSGKVDRRDAFARHAGLLRPLERIQHP